MKKIMLGVVAASISFTLAGCGNDASKFVGTWKEKSQGAAALAIQDHGGGDITVVLAAQHEGFGPGEIRTKAKLMKDGNLEAGEPDAGMVDDIKMENGELVLNDKAHYVRVDASPDKINDIEQQWKIESQKKIEAERSKFRNGFGTLPDPTKVQLVQHK